VRPVVARAVSALLLLLLAAAGGCRREKPWNVLLVTFDTTRADRIGCYGNQRISTPTLDGLAADGVRFANAFSAVPITAPSHTTILTGRYPMAHGVRDNGLFVLAEEQTTLAEILHAAGYATGAAVGAYPVTARFGLDQGFDLFDDHLSGIFEDYLGNRGPKERLYFDERRAAQVDEAIIPWLSEHHEGPFFAWVHYFDPHQPFEPPSPYDQLYADDLYNGEIAYADSRLGFLLAHLEKLGALDHTLVVMTADHGEGRGDHNELTHALLAYNSTLHVPLIIRPPAGAAPAGEVVDRHVGTVDVLPTVLELLGIEPPEGLQGRSLVPLWGEEAGRPGRPPVLYAENLSPRLTHGWGELRVLFDGPLKYIHGPRPELYDLSADPDELHDLSAERSEDSERMRRNLQIFIDRHTVAGATSAQDLDAEVRARLESLGYLQSAGTAGQEIAEKLTREGQPPQDRVQDLNDMSAAKQLLFAGQFTRALQYTERLTRDDPHSPMYLELHASALSGIGRLEEAREAVERLGEEGNVPDYLMLRLAGRRFEAGQQQQAVDDLRRHFERTPSAAGASLLAGLYRRLGEGEAARRYTEQALEIEPRYVPARIDRAIARAGAGDEEGAEADFRQALEDAPYFAGGHYNYGTFLLQTGRYEEAGGHFRRTLDLAPTHVKAHLALVATSLTLGERERAEEAYARLLELAPRSVEAETAAELLSGVGG
jgi:arylsulfatase A-like enzyme/Tfp pilus assembly protein PilF